MDIHNLEQIKQEFSGFQQEFETGNKEKALEKLLELLDALEEADTSRRAAQIDKDGNVFGYVQGAIPIEAMESIVQQTMTGERN